MCPFPFLSNHVGKVLLVNGGTSGIGRAKTRGGDSRRVLNFVISRSVGDEKSFCHSEGVFTTEKSWISPWPRPGLHGQRNHPKMSRQGRPYGRNDK